jgi:hypothetical protein
MKLWALVVAGAFICFSAQADAQQRRDDRPAQSRTEARRQDRADGWTLGDHVWDFKDVLAAYEPVRGRIDTSDERGELAVWKLRLVRDLEDGAARLHEELRGSPFKIVLLDGDRTVINPDVPATITPVPTKADDAIEMYVPLPDAKILRDVKVIRVQRRTDVGF